MAEEKRLENRVKKYLGDHGHWEVKYWGGGQFTKAGIPDLLCCVNGRFMAIELKASHGTPSDLQLVTLEKIEEAGGIAVLLYPKDWDEFVDIVENTPDRDTLDNYNCVRKWHELLVKRGYVWKRQKKS